MAHRRFRVMIFGLCITAFFAFRADAQQNATDENPNKAKIQQLRGDVQSLHRQLGSLHAQMNALREQMHAIQAKLKSDYDQIQSLTVK